MTLCVPTKVNVQHSGISSFYDDVPLFLNGMMKIPDCVLHHRPNSFHILLVGRGGGGGGRGGVTLFAIQSSTYFDLCNLFFNINFQVRKPNVVL